MNLRYMLLCSAFTVTPLLTAGSAHAALADAAAAAASTDAKAVEEVVVTGKFIGTGAGTATKLDIPVLDTPISVAAYTRSFLNAIEVTQVADLYKYMTGVQRAANTGYDITLRGFKTAASDRNAIMTDGLPGLTVRFGSPPTIGTERVEVVKGPASLLYGQAQPGGFVNIITKKPRDVRETEIEARDDLSLAGYGHVGGGLFDLDTTGPLVDGTLDYRLIAEAGETHSFRDFAYERPVLIAPSVRWNLDPATDVTLLVEYRHTRIHYDSFLVAPHNDIAQVASISTTYQEPSDYQTEEGATGTLLANHEFNEHLKANVGYRYVTHEDIAHGWDVVAITPDGKSVTRRARGQDNTRTYSFLDANVVGKFDVGAIGNQAILGVDLGRETSDFNRTQFFNAPATGAQSATISILNPVHGVVAPLSAFPAVNPATPSNLNDRYSVSKSTGLYVSDFITFTPQIKAMVGIRYAKEDLSIHEKRLLNVPDQSASNHKWLPMAGAVYEPTEHVSFYVSYSTSFVPVAPSNQDVNGKYSFSPTTAKSIEGGVKADLFDHRLTTTAAIYDIKKENVINTFSCPIGTCAQQLGAEESKGQEFEVNAQPLPNLQIAAGVSHVDARVTKSNIANQVGTELTQVSPYNAHLWTRYDFADGALKGLGLGLGVSHNSRFHGILPTATSTDVLPIPGYTTVDLAAYYRLKNVDLTFKITNLFGKTYYESAGLAGALGILPGQPRTATITARAHF